ncbi:MAG TPA: RNA polymerase sigma factor [Actinophytocola sp.]|uniref:RNA polymerase sigma factor n=1 Tax=Actinophytocola sp. TaxID=1872138 RepID=UPI002E06DD45|nr:RNA polymerase sigma factor [Actinophytocola sp.]
MPDPQHSDLDRPPFAEVYREHAARVYRYCLSQVGNAGDAEDLATDVFASAFAAYGRERSGPVLPWLLTTARNAIVDHYRRRSRRSALAARFLGAESEADPAADVEGEVVVRDELRRVLRAMRGMPERDRTLLGLRIAADLPYAEIGTVLGVSEHAATVRTRRRSGASPVRGCPRAPGAL